jgi:hypothetical protein
MAKIQELSLYDRLGERKDRYEFSFITTFNAYLPFYEQIVLRRLMKAGCRVNTLLMDSGQFAASMSDDDGKPLLAGRDYTIVPVDAGRGVFHPKILLLLGQEHAALHVGSHNLTLSGFGKNRELTTLFEINPNSESGDRQIFRSVWRALRLWASDQPDELLDSFSFVENEISWLIEKPDDESFAEISDFYFSANNEELALWEQIKPKLPADVRRVTLISPFFDEDLRFLREINHYLKPNEFIVGVESRTVQIPPKAHTLFPDIKFVEASSLRDGSGYLHAKAIYLETRSGEEVLITGSANASGAAWLAGGGRHNCECVVILRSKEASAAIKSLGLRELAKSPTLELHDWQTIESNKLRHANLHAEEDKPLLLTAIETELGFKILSKNSNVAFDSVAELINVKGETIFVCEINTVSNQELFITVEDAQLRFSTNTIKLTSLTGESFTAFIHHTSSIVAKFHKVEHREFFAALENFDIPADDKFWRLFEKIVFTEGDDLPDYMEAQISTRIDVQNLRISEGNTETLQETFSVKTADLGFKERLYRNSLDSVGELLSFLNRRLYSPDEFFQSVSAAPVQSEGDLVETEEYETEDIVDPKFEIERIASLYYQRTRTMMRRMIKKLISANAAEDRVRFAALRQLAVVLGVLHWMRQLETSEKFAACETELVSIDDEWKLFVEATAFISHFEGAIGATEEKQNQPFSEEFSTIVGYLVWLAFDCGFDILKLDELRNQNYGEERLDGWTDEEVLESVACFLKLAVALSDDKQARKTFEKSVETDPPIDWIERNINWMNKISQFSQDILSVPIKNRKALIGDLVYLSKIKKKEILVVSGDSGSIKVIMLNAENRFKKFSADTVVAIDF